MGHNRQMRSRVLNNGRSERRELRKKGNKTILQVSIEGGSTRKKGKPILKAIKKCANGGDVYIKPIQNKQLTIKDSNKNHAYSDN